MTSWSTITFKIDAETVFDKRKSPIAIVNDSGIGEQDWIDSEIYYALSFGRYQEKRFEAFAEKIHCPKYTGISKMIISTMNDTDDTIESHLLLPKQRNYDSRVDGYEKIDSMKGDLWPNEEKEQFLTTIENQWDLEPVIEPSEELVPPDMIIYYTG